MKVAILGYGTVGSGVGEIIEKKASTDVKALELGYILERKENLHKHPLMCDDIDRILDDQDIDVVVETMGGIEPAHTYILQALSAGKHVVSANKAVIAQYEKEFHACAKAHGVKLLYEASCGGGIPWLHQLQSVKRIDSIDEIHGILNGTSNYILDHMSKEGTSFQEVLQNAQDLGYAEADPSADIDGDDIRNKLKISASVAFDCAPFQEIPTFGIRNIRKEDIAYAKAQHRNIKLIATAKRSGDYYGAVIEPTLYEEGLMEASVADNFNLACLHGTTIGDLRFFGQGAGKLPTAHAIVQDLLDLAQEVKLPEPSMHESLIYHPELLTSSYYIRSVLNDKEIQEILHGAIVHSEEAQGCRYTRTKPLEKAFLHKQMERILKKDPQAFMMALDQTGEEQA